MYFYLPRYSFQHPLQWFYNFPYMALHSLFNQFPIVQIEVISMFWAILNKSPVNNLGK
jgi:hypothetical protein